LRERKSGAQPTSYWLIAKRDEICLTEALTVEAGGEEAVTVFSFEEEARLFLLFEAPGAGWRVRETAPGEMIRALFGPRASWVPKVVLDPLPEVLGAETNPLLSLEREEFARRLYAGGGHGRGGAVRRGCRGCGNPRTLRGDRGGGLRGGLLLLRPGLPLDDGRADVDLRGGILRYHGLERTKRRGARDGERRGRRRGGGVVL